MAKEVIKKVQAGQSLWDFAAEHLGSAEGVQQLIELNPQLNFNDSLVAGTELVIGPVINQEVVDYYLTQEVKPATAVT